MSKTFSMSWFKKRFEGGSINAQVGRVFNMFALLVLVLGAVGAVGALRMEQRSNKLADLTEIAFLTASMNRSVTLAKDEMGAYRARGYEPELIESSIQHARDAVAMNERLRLATASVDASYASQVTQLDSGLNDIVTLLGEVRDASRDVVEQESFLGPRYDAIDTAVALIVELREDAATRVETASGEGLFEIQILIASLVAGLLIALGLVFLGKRLVARQVVAPIVEISDVSERIVAGELDLEIPASERDDEIGTLSAALTVLRGVQSEADAQAKRELERELEQERKLKEERERSQEEQRQLLKSLANKFEKTVGDVAAGVAAASSQMEDSATNLARNVESSSSTVSAANSSLKQASDGITGAASASDEFAMSINEVSRQAASSSERARKASEAAAKADATITGLTGSADRISQIVEVIAGIAQRTNLLALNASIEAARGGEAGRGFSVVASEVKELASQTGRATEEVESLIREMQDATGESANALALISTEVVALESTATAIASAVDQQAVAGQDLAQSIDLAARNTQDISATIENVSEVSMTAGSTATQMLASSQEMSLQSEKLREQVAEFLGQVRAA